MGQCPGIMGADGGDRREIRQLGAGEPGSLTKAGLGLGRREFFVDVNSITKKGETFFDSGL